MAKTALIAGKEMPAGSKFADGFSMAGRNISISGPEIEKQEDEEDDSDKIQQISEASGISIVEWNKTSPISSRTIILATESMFGRMDEAILFFDEEWYASLEQRMNTQECIRGCDELILPYQSLALEILSRFELKNSETNPGSLIFLIKETPSNADTLRSPAVRNGISSIASPVVASAAAAFMAFAENIAALYGNQSYVNIYLVRGDNSIDVSASDVEFGRWLGTYIDSAESSGVPMDAKKSLNWIKAGSKISSRKISLPFGKK
ncbi:MAG: hypothetical protein K6G00_00200 [Treponema sp.]|nr:hypothetical protein [Treponema sp.]